ncbi:MAG: HAD-IIIA family hydrolase [Mesorhizobium sp.]|nr:MAG: HAD-IIIA family hydrolase [Mesorhizobium sp.]
MRRRALFLDRDGVLNQDHGYVGSIARTEILPGVLGALRSSSTHGVALIIVTNQSGIAHGHYGWSDF